ncbi:MAG: error-prone DNA polymerase, partial [Planctomycetaceae bacterium]
TGGLVLKFLKTLIGFPRHLSQHPGGMVISRGRLSDLVPVENASMPGRTVIQWDKDDLDALGLLKIDILSLGMLSAIRRAFELIEQHHGRALTLADIPAEDPLVYDMICKADTMGVFQIESRAQMSMLPRLRPRCFYDLVIEVAIVRPGPIQGDMVHPYLRRRSGEEPVDYPRQEVRDVLHRTLGVPIFQEQAMRLAIVAAGFSPGEADQLRRAMGAWRKTGLITKFHEKLVRGMLDRGYEAEFAERVFQQISGFGQYGFPESHAASFALLVYISAWLRRHHPAVFAAALINSQPMGFYAPAQLVRDAREHGVEIRPPDVTLSNWDCTLAPLQPAA